MFGDAHDLALDAAVLDQPVNGTITTFRIRGAAGGADTGRLRVVSPMGVPSLFQASSATVTVPAGTSVSTFTTSLPIAAGDRIGLDDDHAGGSNFGDAGGGGPEEIFQPIPANGTMRNPDFAGGGELLFNADVVPTAVFPTPSRPKPLKGGAAALTVTVPNPGTLSVASADAKGAAASKKRKGAFIKPVSATVAAAGDVTVKLRPTKSTKAVLGRFGQANGRVQVTFTPAGGSPASQLVAVRLRRR